jgi:transcription elongation factor GreA
MTVITQYGVGILKKRMDALQEEMKNVMVEMKEVRDNSLSTEDNTETNEYNQRYDALQKQYSELKDIMSNATVVDVTTIQTDKVTVGSVVTLLNIDTDQEVVYRLVGSVESDPAKGMISYTSPVGKEMMGLRVDDAFEINVGPNTIEYEIVSIEAKPL